MKKQRGGGLVRFLRVLAVLAVSAVRWEDVTGYNFEPWHVRYVGLEAAAALHENPMPFETYLLGLREERLNAMMQGASAGEE